MSNVLHVWTGDDYEHGACRADQVGTPKPELESPQEVLNELPPATMAEFKQAVLRFARGKTGSYDKFLADNPGFAQKFLLAMVKEPPPPVKQDLTVHISWLTPERLAYKHAELVQEVQEVTEVKQIEEAKPWKPEQPDGLAKTMRDYPSE